MGDSPRHVQIVATESDGREASASSNQPSTTPSQSQSQQPNMIVSDTRPSHLRHSSPPPQPRHDAGTLLQQPGHGIYNMPSPHGQPPPFNMAQMAAALPDYANIPSQQYQRQMQQSGPHPGAGPSTPAVVYQLQQQLQYPPTASYPPLGYAGYPPQPQYQHGYGQPPGSPQPGYAGYSQGQQQPGMPSRAHQYPQSTMPYYYYPDAYGGQGGASAPYPPQAAQFPAIPRSGMGSDQRIGRRQSGSVVHGGPFLGEEAAIRQQPEQQSSKAVPRGPPRKPKQSGHALWVGNLPPNATILALKDHFSRDFTREIESLFLISKSNCAFVNYRSEDACARAMIQFHDSRFEGVRLVCRLRKGVAATSGAPAGPVAMARSSPLQTESPTSKATPEEDPEETVEAEASAADEEETSDGASPTLKESERYFIVKSLTLQDLEQSVRNGIWATQSHNEEALNAAYAVSDNVYLIFSANKSGEYFGYARMASSIAENAAELFGAIPRVDNFDSMDASRTIPTPATKFAPRGHIIDDSARGTIFWEAEFTDDETEEEVVEPSEADGEAQTWGKPFKVEWMSTIRVPFYRTRGLRNPWNANREVKIARDGTELEPRVGRLLIQLFHRSSPTQ